MCLTLLDYHRAGGIVTEPLAAPAHPYRDYADEVAGRQEVNDADEVADRAVPETDGRAVITNHAQAGHALADALPICDHLDDDPVGDEGNSACRAQDDHRHNIERITRPVQRSYGKQVHAQDDERRSQHGLHHGVNQAGERPRPDAGKLVLDLNVFRCLYRYRLVLHFHPEAAFGGSVLRTFVERHKPTWERLEALLERCHSAGGVSKLTSDELCDLGSLYRQAASHLALARTRDYHPETITYLNQLMGRAHGVVHARRHGRGVRLGYFFGIEVPATFKKCFRYFAVCAALLIAGTTIGALATARNPGWAEIFTTPGFRAQVESFLAETNAPGEYFSDISETIGGPGFAGFLMTHNIKVALICFVAGISFGLGTLYLLAGNSLMLGAALGLGAYQGKLVTMGAVVVPHGVIEVSAILLAAAAGLRFGYSLVNPGDMLRRDALVLAAHEAVRLVAGTIPIFITAGLIEGLISPLASGTLATDIARYAIGGLTGVTLYVYLFYGDRLFARYFPDAPKQTADNGTRNPQTPSR